MFIGEYSHTIDAKGRLIVPSKFREQLGDEFVVTKGLDGCLFVYENSEWKSFEEKLHALPLTNANARKFSRFFMAGASPGWCLRLRGGQAGKNPDPLCFKRIREAGKRRRLSRCRKPDRDLEQGGMERKECLR